jgi:hypothetical protein
MSLTNALSTHRILGTVYIYSVRYTYVVVFTPRPRCSELIFDHMCVFTVQNGQAKLVSDSGMVQWLGRYKGGLVWLEKGTLPKTPASESECADGLNKKYEVSLHQF